MVDENTVQVGGNIATTPGALVTYRNEVVKLIRTLCEGNGVVVCR